MEIKHKIKKKTFSKYYYNIIKLYMHLFIMNILESGF